MNYSKLEAVYDQYVSEHKSSTAKNNIKVRFFLNRLFNEPYFAYIGKTMSDENIILYKDGGPRHVINLSLAPIIDSKSDFLKWVDVELTEIKRTFNLPDSSVKLPEIKGL